MSLERRPVNRAVLRARMVQLLGRQAPRVAVDFLGGNDCSDSVGKPIPYKILFGIHNDGKKHFHMGLSENRGYQ